MSSFLTLAYIIPVVAGNEETHVDEPKKSTSFWIRTGLELLLGAGCVGGVIREFQNRTTIKSRDAEISNRNQTLNQRDKKILELTQTLKEQSAGLTEAQQTKLTALKALIETVYGNEYTRYLTITDTNVGYKVDKILELPDATKLGLTAENFKPTKETGIIQTLELDISGKRFEYDNVHNIPPYNWCLLQLVDLETCLMLQLCDTINSKALDKTNKALIISNNTIKELQSNISTNIQTHPMLRKVNFKSLALKLIQLANEKSANENYWKSFTDNGQTIYDISKNKVTFGESLFLLASKNLFRTELNSKLFTLETKNFKGQISGATFLTKAPTIDSLQFKTLKKESTLKNYLETKQLTLENILDIFTNQEIITQFDEYLVTNTNFYNLDTPIVKEYILLQLSIKFLVEYCGYTSYKQKLTDLTHDSGVTNITSKVDEVWGQFQEHIESIGLKEVKFSSVV